MTAIARMSPQEARDTILERLAAKPAAEEAPAPLETASQGAAPRSSLAQTLIRLDRMDEETAEKVKTASRRMRTPFGQTAKRLGLLNADDLDYALGVQLGVLRETKDRVRIPAPLVLVRRPYSAAAEEFRRLRARLLTSAPAESLQLFAVASAEAKVGGAPSAANLAAAFAQIGRRVLLIDANLRRPTLSALFGDPAAPGLREVLENKLAFEEAASSTMVTSLDLLPAGASVLDPQPFFMSAAFATLLERSQAVYDHVIMLTAPHGDGGGGELVWASARQVFVIARKHQVRAAHLRAMREVVRSAGANVLGAAFIG